MSTTKTQQRVSFSTVKNRVPYPDLLEVQLKSFRDFFQMDTTAENRKNEGLYKVFQENFPITDTRNNFVLEFIDYYIDPPRYSIEECLERGLTYSVPLKAKLKLYCTDDEHEDFGVVVQDVYFGTIPYMTERGTFVINGAERVIVSQLHRSPGVFFGQSMHTNGTKLYSARIIPFKGSWIEFATDINNVMYAYIDRKKKLPVTTLLRAIGFEADQQILEIFDLADEVKVTKAALKKAVGRKLAARVLSTWVEDFVDEDTGEVVSIERNNVIVDRETVLQEEHIDQIIESGAKTILLHKENPSGIDFSIIYNTLQKDPCNSEKEAVVYIYRQLRASEPPAEATARDVIEQLVPRREFGPGAPEVRAESELGGVDRAPVGQGARGVPAGAQHLAQQAQTGAQHQHAVGAQLAQHGLQCWVQRLGVAQVGIGWRAVQCRAVDARFFLQAQGAQHIVQKSGCIALQ